MCKNTFCAKIAYAIQHLDALKFWGTSLHKCGWNMGHFTYLKSKVASLLWFAHFGMRICGGAQLLNNFQLMDCRSIPLNFEVNTIGQRSSKGIQHGISHACLPSIVMIFKTKGLFMPIFSPQTSSSSMFQDPTHKSHFNHKTCPWKLHN